METKHLRIFVTVYRSSSFTKAAELLSTSQPAISENIKALENGLGSKLFDRLGRSIRPTRKAEMLFPKALAILEDISQIEEELAAEDQSVTGELILGASSIPGAYLLPQLLTVFKAHHPGILFKIRIADSGEIIDSVLNYDFLIGIVGSKSASKKLNFSPFVDDELVLAASVERKIPDKISLQKLRELPLLIRESGSGTRKSMEEFGITKGFGTDHLNIVAVLGSNAAIIEAIKTNLGVSILSRISICDELENGKIREIKVKGLTMKRMFYVITLKNRTLPNHYSVFLQRLQGIEDKVLVLK